MNRLLNYLLLFIVILIFSGLVVPFAMLQVQVNSDGDLINKILNNDFHFPPVRNALIAGILIPIIATVLLSIQQYFYIKFLKTKMEYPVKKELVKQYQWIGIATGGLIVLSMTIFICAFAIITNKWEPKKILYIFGMVVTSLYGFGIYIWATVVNMRIIYDQAKQQAIIDQQNNDKNPPNNEQIDNNQENVTENKSFENEETISCNEKPTTNENLEATSGNF